MKRNLFTQIKNEWRDNLWLVIALTIVIGLIWIAAMISYVLVKPTFLPRGFEYKNVYSLDMHTISKNSPYHTTFDTDDVRKEYYTDFRMLINRLKENPNVESVASHWSALPYSMNYNGFSLSRMDIVDTIPYTGNRRQCSPEVIDVLSYESLTGKTREQLKEMLSRGEILISDYKDYEKDKRNIMDLIGKTVFLGGDSSKVYKIGDVIHNVRRNDYEQSWNGTIVVPLSEDTPWGDIIVKVRDGHDNRFKEDFRNNIDLRQQRNIYLSNLTKLADTRKMVQRDHDTTRHLLLSLMTFLLLTIFLGLLGTFWFRMQQRVGEIAIRKVSGATRADIFRRVISEGLILLAIGAVLASLLLIPLISFFQKFLGFSYTEWVIVGLVSIGMVALGIILSLWYPAARAMRIEPAIALKTE